MAVRTEPRTPPQPSVDADWLVQAAARLITAPVTEVIPLLGELVDEVLPGGRPRLVALLTGDCSRSPMKVRGEAGLPGAVTSAELAVLAGTVDVGTARTVSARIGGAVRRVVVVAAAPAGPVGSLFAIDDEGDDAATPSDRVVRTLQALCDLTAAVYVQRATEAAPGPIVAENRAAAQERSRTIVELSEAHEATLTALLSTLRARDLGDAVARTSATDLAVAALIDLRQTGHRDRALSEEPAGEAFERLREQLAPISRYASTTLELAGPGTTRAVPSELAHGARAICRGVALVLLEQEAAGRIRIGWEVRAEQLVVTARDDGPGALTTEALAVHRTLERVAALDGQATVDAVPGWGTTVTITLPLAPVDAPAPSPLALLNARELEVLTQLLRGGRNADIASALTITSHTVKFHLGNILRKTGAKSRGEAAAIAREHGLTPPPA